MPLAYCVIVTGPACLALWAAFAPVSVESFGTGLMGLYICFRDLEIAALMLPAIAALAVLLERREDRMLIDFPAVLCSNEMQKARANARKA